MNTTPRNILHVSIIALAAIIVSWRLFFSGSAEPPQKTPEELRAVLEATVSEEYVPPPLPADSPEYSHAPAPANVSYTNKERIDAIGQLGQIGDRPSVPLLLDAMNDPDPAVRGRAAAAARKIMKADYGFKANDTPERRAEDLEFIRSEWAAFQEAGFK